MFSVIVCTYNKLEYLKKCIDSLLTIDYPEYEIIIVNDGSTDGTKEYLDNLKNDKIKAIHHTKNQGLSVARNTGIKNSKYEYLAFTDDDCLVDKNWLTELATGFKNEKTGFVIGQIFYIDKNYQGYFPERLVKNINAVWPMGSNIAYHKKVFTKCGIFEPLYFKYNNEDSEMALRAIANGFEFTRLPSAIVKHQPINWTVKSLLNSARNASVWVLFKKKYPNTYKTFGTPIKFNIIYPQDYLYLLLFPILIPLVLIRYLINGKRNLKIFFTKWPLYFILRRYYIWKEIISK